MDVLGNIIGRALRLIQVNRVDADRGFYMQMMELFFADATIIACATPETPRHFAVAKPKMRSPRIVAIAWGKIDVKGIGTLKDATVE